jgi:uncharacterized membrane protein
MIGPIQLLAIQFDDINHFTGEIMRALRDLRRKGLIRVIDILFIAKDVDNELTTFSHSDLNDAELAEFGSVLGAMFGLNEPGEPVDPEALGAALEMAKSNFGLEYSDVQDLASKIKPGQAAGIMLFENMWATELRDAIHNSGGRAVMQGYLTPQALTMVGAELYAVVDAQQTIEAADAVKGAAILDALLTVEAVEAIAEEAMMDAAAAVMIGQEIKTAVAADVLRTLVMAGYIEDMAVQHALDTLAVAGLIEEEALQSAMEINTNGRS